MDTMDAVMPYVLALVPTIGVATLFYFIIKTILEGDRRERIAQAKWEADHDRASNGTNRHSETPGQADTNR
ncbi:hypothetical protein GCM10027053_13260 [Intrasporangium mesophilum]